MDCVKVLRSLMRMVCERLKREQQRAALVRWRGVPCQARERADVAARGREAQLVVSKLLFGEREGHTCKKIWIVRLRQPTMVTMTMTMTRSEKSHTCQ